MARKKKSVETPATIVRDLSPLALEKRVFNMDNSPRRSWDLFALEERIYQLEVNGGGASSPVKFDSGTFTTPAEQQGTIEITFENITGIADYIVVEFTLEGTKKSVASFDKTMFDASVEHKYCSKWIIPAESANYNIVYGATTGDAGIVGVDEGKFTFKSGGWNTVGVTATYKAYKYVGE